MDELKKIRWRQRFSNLERAFIQLQRGLAINDPSDIEIQGIIKSFEFTFELSWKTIKDYLESQRVVCQFPREAIKQAFHYQILTDGDVWLDMLGKRNLLAHTYDESIAMEACKLIREQYAPRIKLLIEWLGKSDGEAGN